MVRRSIPLAVLTAVLALTPGLLAPRSALALGEMDFHGGSVISVPTVYLIFWLPHGFHFDAAGTDTRFEGLVTQFVRDLSGTPYYNDLTQYSCDRHRRLIKGGPIQNKVTFGCSYLETSKFPHAGTLKQPLTPEDIRRAVSAAVKARAWQPRSDHLFFMYLPATAIVCFNEPTMPGSRRPEVGCTAPTRKYLGAQQECDIRDFFGAASAPIYYDAIGDCHGEASASPNHDPWVDGAIARTAFELTEEVTDPKFFGWYSVTPTGGEVSDDCGDLHVALHGHRYQLDALWDNADRRCTIAYPFPTPPAVRS